jgi:23S rRNA pseudouridine1911/1915/1917 synthase
MAVVPASKGRRAVTRYRLRERFADFTFVEVKLETGRTHQIRVHLASLGHPVVGDDTYGGKPRARSFEIDGHALHAAALGFRHPATQKMMVFESPLPARIEALLSHLRNTR